MDQQNLNRFAEIFLKVQQTPSSHRKCCSILEKIFKESDFNDFVQEFTKCLTILFLDANFTINPYATRALNFCVQFCMTLDKHNKDEDITSPFLVEVFNCSLKLHNVANARYRMCQFLNKLLSAMSENETFLDEEICERIRDVMLQRIDDIKPCVRFQAVEILQRLQDPQDAQDIIIKNYIRCLPDSSAQVRGAIVQCIGLNKTTIPVVLGRCCDTDANVRYTSYTKFAKIPIRALKVEHRQHVLKNGFKDQNAKVRQFIEKTLLPHWLSDSDNNYFQLILALKLDADESDFKQTIEIVQRVLDIFFKNNDITKLMEVLPLGNEKLITSGEIHWEEFIFWRCLIEFLRNQKDEQQNELVDQIIPELSFFSRYLKKVYQTRSNCKTDWETLHHDHILIELIKIAKTYDFSDEVGRRELHKIVTYILSDAKVSMDNVELLTEILETLSTNTEGFASEICAIVSDIREPLTLQPPSEDMIFKKEVKCGEIRIKIDIAQDDQDTAVEKKDYAKAQELKLYIKELRNQLKQINQDFEEAHGQVRIAKNDVHTLIVCLDLLTAMMKSKNINAIPEAVKATMDELVEPLLISTNAEIFSRALMVKGYCCSVNKEIAKQSIHLFTAPILAHKYMPMYDDQTTIIAINCLADMMMLYGSDILEIDSTMTITMTKRPSKKRSLLTESQIVDESSVALTQTPTASLEVIIETLADLLDDDTPEIRLKSGEAIVKLICTGTIRSSMLLTKLILKWFNPTTARDQRLRQFIGQLFNDYRRRIPSSLEILEQSYIPTVQAIMDAPVNSPLADVNIDSVLSFLAALSKPYNHQHNVGLDSHKNIALRLCGEICDRPNNKLTSTYLRGLLQLTVPTHDEVAISDLRKQVDLMFELITEKSCQKLLLKYKNKLEADYEHQTNTNPTTTTTTTITNTNVPVEKSNDPEVTNTTQQQKQMKNKFPSLSVKRKKKRIGKSNNNPEQTQTEYIDSIEASTSSSTQTVIITETDSDTTTSTISNQSKTSEELKLRRSTRSKKKKKK